MSFEDAFLNWTFEETAMLTVDLGKEGRKEFHAEIHREPVMGFSPKREIITVRLFANVYDLPHLPEQEEGWTLYLGDSLFGKERGWKCIGGYGNECSPEKIQLFLQD